MSDHSETPDAARHATRRQTAGRPDHDRDAGGRAGEARRRGRDGTGTSLTWFGSPGLEVESPGGVVDEDQHQHGAESKQQLV